MTRASIIAFVEGLLDRMFYDTLLRSCAAAEGLGIEVRTSDEIDRALGSGKTAVISLYDKAKRRNKLSFHVGTTKKTILFFLDKDIDEILRKRKQSKHVIYTKHYCIENYLFINGNLEKSVQTGAFLNEASTRHLPANADWRKNAAISWKEWTAFCIMAKKLNPPNVPNYSAKSQFNVSAYASHDPNKLSALLSTVAYKKSLPLAEIIKAFERELRRVEKLVTCGQFDKVFRGKWYFDFLVADVDRIAPDLQIPQSLPQRLESSLVGTLDFNAPWSLEFHAQIEQALTSNISNR